MRQSMPSKTTDISIKAIAPISYTLYYGTFIHTPTLTNLEISFNTIVGVNSQGVIDYIYKEYHPIDHNSQSPIEFFCKQQGTYTDEDVNFIDISRDYTKFFFPGFIDTHIHASQFPNVGIGLDTPLLDWLNKYTFPLESQFCGDGDKKMEFAKLVYTRVIQRTLLNGTTCASYFTTIDPETSNYFAELLLKLGQRGFVGKVCMDCNEPYPKYEESLEDCIKSMNKIIDHLDDINPEFDTLVKPIITPRFAPVCTREMLTYLGNLSKRKSLPIQTHISENKSEIELVAKMFPDCGSYAEVYNRYNLLNEATILAHCIHFSPEECQLIADKNCSVSHCPTSNTFISSGEAPIRKYLYDYHINVSLGTDISGGFDSSILHIIKHAILVSHHLSMKPVEETAIDCKLSMTEGLYMSTMGGARAVGLEDQIGSFTKGKKFDCQLIDLSTTTTTTTATDVFAWQVPQASESADVKYAKMVDLLGKWVFSGDDRNCVAVWCNGRQVVDKTTTTGVDAKSNGVE